MTRAGAHAGCRLAVLALLALGCTQATLPAPPPGATALRDDVFVEALAPGVWRHVTWRVYPSGPFPSNGLIVEAEEGALLVDTAWNDAQTALVLDWVQERVGPVRALVITHAHDDRLGGIAEAHRRGIPSVALHETVRIAQAEGWPSPTRPVASGFSLAVYGVEGELFFPGAGHSPDNAVVHLRAQRILAGTCMVRARATRSPGNLVDADLAAWPASIEALQARYPDLALVVPGHGEPGDRALLAHTLQILEARSP